MRPLSRLAFVPVFAIAALFSGCDYFSNVVVPAVDTTAPTAFSGVYDIFGQRYEALAVDSVDFEVTDPTVPYAAVGATYDNGGAKSVQITGTLEIDCHSNDGLGQYQVQDWAPLTASQSGSVGSTVSNGVYQAYGINFSQLAVCPDPGFSLEWARFSWTTESIDFHGNTSASSGSMTYEP
jgi:hypothetical protein